MIRKFSIILSLLPLLLIFGLTGCTKEPPPDNGEQILYYYTGGPIRSIKNYKNKKLHGSSKIFYKNGVVKYKANYIDGLLDGEVVKYAQDGEVIVKARFKNGEAVDKQHVYLQKVMEKG